MSPSTCIWARGQASIMSESPYLSVMLIVDLSLASVVQHSPFAFAYAVQVISHVSHAQCLIPRVVTQIIDRIACTCMHMTTITLCVKNLILSSLKWSPHKHIHVYIHIKPLPVSRVFGARSGSPQIIIIIVILAVVQTLWEGREGSRDYGSPKRLECGSHPQVSHGQRYICNILNA